MLADVGDALLGFRFASGLGLRWKREDSCVLPFIEPRQQHDLAIRELERIMIGVKRALVDLAKDRNGVAGIGTKLEGGLILALAPRTRVRFQEVRRQPPNNPP